jgi:hypothetical protein
VIDEAHTLEPTHDDWRDRECARVQHIEENPFPAALGDFVWSAAVNVRYVGLSFRPARPHLFFLPGFHSVAFAFSVRILG